MFSLQGRLEFIKELNVSDPVFWDSDQIYVNICLKNDTDSDMFIYFGRINHPKECNNWKIRGKGGEGYEGEKITNTKVRDIKTCDKKKFKFIPAKGEGKFPFELKAVFQYYDFDEEGKIQISYNGNVEFAEKIETPREIKKVKIVTNMLEIEKSK